MAEVGAWQARPRAPALPGGLLRRTARGGLAPRRARDWVVHYFEFPPALRRVAHTAHAIESVHRRLRKFIRTRGLFPSDDAASRLTWLAPGNITADWHRAAKEWTAAMNQFAIRFEVRCVQAVHGAGRWEGLSIEAKGREVDEARTRASGVVDEEEDIMPFECSRAPVRGWHGESPSPAGAPRPWPVPVRHCGSPSGNAAPRSVQ
jgi:hypothetical protein